jgi:hypothetical protein
MIGLILNILFRNMVPGEPRHRRIFHPGNSEKDLTVIVCPGQLDAHRLAGALEILSGHAHARRYARKKGDRQMMIVEEANVR